MKLITMAACGFGLWILQAVIYHHFWRRGLKAALSFNRPWAAEGERAMLTETVTNAKALPLPVLHVKFQMGKYLVFTSPGNFMITDQNYRSDIFSCMPWQEIRRNLEFSCKKRGYYTITQVQLVTYDLFFSGRLVASLPVCASLYVYPKEVAFERLQLPFQNLWGQLAAFQALITDPFETQSVRPYQSYDSYRTINWKATAPFASPAELEKSVGLCNPTLHVLYEKARYSHKGCTKEDLAALARAEQEQVKPKSQTSSISEA